MELSKCDLSLEIEKEEVASGKTERENSLKINKSKKFSENCLVMSFGQ
jgi:hypothetical protein